MDGPTVVVLPGCPDSRLIARSGEQAALRAGVHLVGVNRPGYGRSDPAASGHLSVADDLTTVADHLGVARFAVAGMSVGGPYALAAAARHPDRVAAAAAVAAPSPATEFWRVGQRDLLALTIDEAITAMRPEFEKYVAGMRPGDPDDNAIAGRYTAELHPIDADALAALPAADVAAGAREALSRTDGYLRDAAATFRPWTSGRRTSPARYDCGMARTTPAPISATGGGSPSTSPARASRSTPRRRTSARC